MTDKKHKRQPTKRKANKPKRQSYRDLAPQEAGGPIARQGHNYQDHIAANKCLDMLFPGGPSEVWCEAEDDIVLVWDTAQGEVFEFVQVKGTEIGQAWTVPKLCAAEAGKDNKPKSSIVEKSLGHDRGLEPACFRLVTRWKPHSTLGVLLQHRSDRMDSDSQQSLAAAAAKLDAQLPQTKSPNGHGLEFWIAQTEWEHVASEDDAKRDGLVKLLRVVEDLGEYLAVDQAEELYVWLLVKVQNAALPGPTTGKRITAASLRKWIGDKIVHIRGKNVGGTKRLESKLVQGGISPEQVESAKELRRSYAMEARRPKYFTADEIASVEGEIVAALHMLKADLDAGNIDDDAKQFHARCLREVDAVAAKSHGGRFPARWAQGCMYNVMNRCLHRLVRVTS